ncbi:MAG TPA: glycoside hydrolase family 43 protein [Bryobacteraceae bacterium]|nr:glycoside hydrolase family 43 protein [Bryobacteraceae bacterium]
MEYCNPVYPSYFADPFVWRHQDHWYAVGTGLLEAHSQAGRASESLTMSGEPGVFQLLQSHNMVEWKPLGSALELLPPEFGNTYWAPEVAFAEGKFWMYYSVGREDKAHHIRVAISDDPRGPYVDTGVRLTDPFRCPFAIDGSPYQDVDGAWYLFYAVDFLDADEDRRAGTGVVVDRLVSMTELAGSPQPVVRARHDWQRFLRNRIMYGAYFDWHTIEGPCVRKRHGRYWCLFSAGRWENETYGVDWAVADDVLGPWEFVGSPDGARLLRTRPGEVLGPGHNCVVTGPDGASDYIVYHAWDPAMTARRMFMDKLDWTPRGPVCEGPSLRPQGMR